MQLSVNRFCHLCCIIATSVLLGACSTLPENSNPDQSLVFSDTANTTFGRYFKRESEKHAGESGVYLLSSGKDALAARLGLLALAERSIDAQYYLYHSDQTSRLFTSKLIKSADRGVRVRLLVDDIDLGGRERGALLLDAHPNIEVRFFNPFSRAYPRVIQFVTRFGDVTRRMHNKSLSADNQISIVGGRNIGNEYFDASDEANFTDLDAMVIGPAARQINNSFDDYWNNERAYPVALFAQELPSEEEARAAWEALHAEADSMLDDPYIESLQQTELAQAFGSQTIRFHWADIRAVFDDPRKFESDSTDYLLAPDLAPLFRDVKDRLTIISPYFVPGKRGTQFLIDLAERGVNVDVITNSLASTDVAVVHAGYVRYRKKLMKGGVKVHEVQAWPTVDKKQSSKTRGSSSASLHSKSFVFDYDRVFIGSLNLDPRSIHENSEIGLIIDSPAVAREMMDWAEDFSVTRTYELTLTKSWTGRHKISWIAPINQGGNEIHHEPDVGIFKRMMVNLLRFVPMESQL